jgi:DNA-binding transcriptional ArsR family regulator
MDDRCCDIFNALGDRTRLTILELVREKERCVSEICEHFHISQPSVSHHLDILKRCGLVEAEKRGREVFYRYRGDTIVECCGKQLSLLDLMLRQSETARNKTQKETQKKSGE